mgnify:CR=1 FL=1
MAALKQQLQQKLQQKLSPQQIQLIRLLELTEIEFEERVQQELVDNPALEEGREEIPDSINEFDANADEDGNPGESAAVRFEKASFTCPPSSSSEQPEPTNATAVSKHHVNHFLIKDEI